MIRNPNESSTKFSLKLVLRYNLLVWTSATPTCAIRINTVPPEQSALIKGASQCLCPSFLLYLQNLRAGPQRSPREPRRPRISRLISCMIVSLTWWHSEVSLTDIFYFQCSFEKRQQSVSRYSGRTPPDQLC